jgi:hypothetical protein
LFPDTIERLAAAPAAAVAVKPTLSNPEADAVSVCAPAVVPRVQPPTEAVPDVELVTVELATDPPALALNVTVTPSNGSPSLPITFTVGPGVTALPTVPLKAVEPLGTRATATISGSVPPEEHETARSSQVQMETPFRAVMARDLVR